MLSGKHIYVVEDDRLVSLAMADGLAGAGATVDCSEDGDSLLRVISSAPPDAALIDLRLPGRTGLELLTEIRKVSNIPAIIVTGQGDEFDEVTGLQIGADDFIRKPFVMRVLIARTAAVLRRWESAGGVENSQLSDLLGERNWELDTRMRRLIGPGDLNVPLTATEVRILSMLAGRPGDVVDRGELYEQIFSRELSEQSRTIDVLISRLRQKLRTTRRNDRELQISSVYGKGYSLGWSDSAGS